MKNFFYTLTLGALLMLPYHAYTQKVFEIGLDHETPLGDMSFVYRSAFGPRFTWMVQDDERRSLGFTMGFHFFVPKEKVFYYLVGDNDYGTISYSNYYIAPLVASGLRKIRLADRVNLRMGGDVGLYLVYYSFSDNNSFIGYSETNLETKMDISPKAGIAIRLTESVHLSLQTKFNFFLSVNFTGSGGTYIANQNYGNYNYTWSNGLGLILSPQ